MSKATRVNHQYLAALKWLASFTSREWELKDYPVFVRKQVEDQSTVLSPPRFKIPTFVASIVNWHLSGFADSPEEARAALAKTFADVKASRVEEGRPLPRPGIKVPIEFASTVSIEVHPDLAQDFVQRVLDLESAWISDESSLWDFHAERSNDNLVERVHEVYGVDVSDIKSGLLCKILDRIAKSQALERSSNPVS